MSGRKYKEWYRKTRPDRYVVQCTREMWRFDKPLRRALKFAKKSLRVMSHCKNDAGCGLWFDEHCGDYRELCMVGGECSKNDCPYELAKRLVECLQSRHA